MPRLPQFPDVKGPVPGPRSAELAGVLAAAEAPNCFVGAPLGPLVWAEAENMTVVDADGNVLLDGTGGFGTAAVGHANPRVVANVQAQALRCMHALADVHAAEPRAALVQRLSSLAPPPLEQVYLAQSGSEAVEIALKTALRHTGKPGVVCLEGAYHGVAGTALAVTDFPALREPFEALHAVERVTRIPFPDARADFEPEVAAAEVARITAAFDDTTGAFIFEPVQYRGGVRAVPTSVLQGVAKACKERGILLIADEIATGLGRTGAWFASQGAGVVPDLACVGKALGGGMPVAACIGTPEVMASWTPEPPGEALHTSTALGHPVACAAACGVLAEIQERGLLARAAQLGQLWLEGLTRDLEGHRGVGAVRGYGCMLGIDVVERDPEGNTRPDAWLATGVAKAALERGLIVVPDGPANSTLILSPPLTIVEAQVSACVRILREAFDEVCAA
jgi:4-aminobutyrate aminotransferase-like enzyme